MKPKNLKDPESPANLAKEYIHNKYESKKSKSVVPIGPKFVITQPRVAQVKAELNIILLSIMMFAMFYSFGCNKTVTISKLEWTAENLNVEHYRNGDVIPQVQDADVWSKLTTGAWCYYENNSENGKTYGKLYNWYAVNDKRGLAPEGWHIPSDAEWTVLVTFLGGDSIAGGKLKATTLWASPNTGAMNSSGFAAFPSGSRLTNGYFQNIGKDGNFWSSSEVFTDLAWNRLLNFNYSDVTRPINLKRNGYSVRCVKD
ncbi:MAG: fibrobacter succinogenes major paralogous domain-containing protein [Ignavibacteriae bacterium]|nr:fibrobacter succinogenes major paralogous domain-containing protein [Ignavibacteriota bacterium]